MFPPAPRPLQTGIAPPSVGPDAPGAASAIAALFGNTPALTAAAPADPYADDVALKKLFGDFRKLCFDGRWVYERNWWRNLLYILGRQWIFYNVQRGAWQDKRMQKWIPRPVTNKFAETVDAMRSVFQGVDLEVKVRPISDDPVDTITAETAELAHAPIRDEHDMRARLYEADFWSIATGNVFIHPWFDRRAEHGMLLVPFEQCAQCNTVSGPADIVQAGHKCPKCGSPNFVPAMDQQGQPIGKEYPVGRGCTDVCSPFEIGFPAGYGNFGDLPGIIRQRWRTKAWYEKNMPELAKTLRFEKQTSERSLQMLKAIASQSDISGTALGAQVNDAMQPEGIVEFELWMKPTPTYPRGLLLRVAGGEGAETIVRAPNEQLPGPLPMTTSKGQPIFPWIHMGYSRFGGRIWARSPLDLVIQKQDQINQLDSLILLGVQRMSNPVWIEPKGAEVKKFTGEPGLVVKYNPLVAGGNAKPERIEGANIPQSLLTLREQYLADFETLVGTQDVLKGAKPAGVEAFSAMQLLVERAQSRFGPVLSERGEAYRAWYALALEIERQFGPMERVWATMGPNRRWAFQSFRNTDVQGSVRILMEDGSQAPKTNLGKRAAIEGLNNLQALNLGDPDQRMRIYQVYGATDLLPKLDSDVQSALAEQAAFVAWAKSPLSIPRAVAPAPGPPSGLPSGAGGPVGAPAGAPAPGGAPPAPPMGAAPPMQPPGTGQPPMQPPAVMQPPPLPPAAPPAPPTRAYFDEGEPGESAVPMPTFVSIAASPMQRKLWHDDEVHISEHRKWANSEDARLLFKGRPDLEQAFTMHLMEHEQAVAQKQMAMAGPPPGGPPPPPRAPSGRAKAMQNSNQESGKRGAGLPPPA